jgi:hypothetical protein
VVFDSRQHILEMNTKLFVVLLELLPVNVSGKDGEESEWLVHLNHVAAHVKLLHE